MGMTYRIIALPKGQSAKDWCQQTLDADCDTSGDDLMGATELVDDMVFDRERLAAWLGLGRKSWVDEGCAVLTPYNVRRAKGVLQRLVDLVSEMPYTPDPPTGHLVEDVKTGGVKYEYEGSPENVAIVKEVEKVLLRTYHFNYKWQPDRPFGVPHMIKALNDVLAFMEANHDRVVMALYY